MKKVVFLTGTRADFGKLKPLIEVLSNDSGFEVMLFVTGMHMQSKYGHTVDEIVKCGYRKIHKFINHTSDNSMDLNLAKTIQGFSDFIKENETDLIVIHGDRVEALAGAIVGSLNNILVAHIEGGEVSGTIDELIRHSVSKLSHTHFVANAKAKSRLIQMGEMPQSIFEIGSPDIDVILSKDLPLLEDVRRRYGVNFNEYSILLFHPVTTELSDLKIQISNIVEAAIKSGQNYIVIYPNNDLGTNVILEEYERLKTLERFKVYPSVRFEYFLTLLKNAQCIVGNSSAGIREAPYYGVNTVNIGSRQNNRAMNTEIIHCSYDTKEIIKAINYAVGFKYQPKYLFGEGKSAQLFQAALLNKHLWSISSQKQFKDLVEWEN